MGCRYVTPALLIAAALARRGAAVPQLAAGGDASAPLELVGLGHMSRAFQLSCHSSGDAVADLPELTAKLAFVQGVCCTQLHESCELEMLPTSCGEPACARVVKLVADACGPMLSSSDFFSGFKEALDAAAHVCADVPAQRATYTMADPTLRLSPIVVSPGRLTDGMGVPGHWTATGQERVTIRAPTGQRVRLLLETQWLGSDDVLILYNGVDENEKLAQLRGTKLPADPLFISTGEEIRVLLVTSDVGEGVATSFSALFDFICEDDAGCGGRGKCREGRCNCPAGYFGDACEDDSCASVDCGAHGICKRGGTCKCADGYSGEHCEDADACAGFDCGTHGSCQQERQTAAARPVAPAPAPAPPARAASTTAAPQQEDEELQRALALSMEDVPASSPSAPVSPSVAAALAMGYPADAAEPEPALQVIGAGTTKVNGRYRLHGEHNGKPKYVKVDDASISLVFNGRDWNLKIGEAEAKYWIYNSDALTPTGGWQVYRGQAPAPRVTSASAGRCACDGGYSGDHCQNFDPCFEVDCGAHGICERGGTCRCLEGYSGDHCDEPPAKPPTWHLGNVGESCSKVCSNVGRGCTDGKWGATDNPYTDQDHPDGPTGALMRAALKAAGVDADSVCDFYAANMFPEMPFIEISRRQCFSSEVSSAHPFPGSTSTCAAIPSPAGCCTMDDQKRNPNYLVEGCGCKAQRLCLCDYRSGASAAVSSSKPTTQRERTAWQGVPFEQSTWESSHRLASDDDTSKVVL